MFGRTGDVRMTDVVQTSGAVGSLTGSTSADPIWGCLHRTGVNDTSKAQIASITDRIDKRLAAISEHQAAIRAELRELTSLQPDHPSDSLLTIDDACSRLHVSRATMFRLMVEDCDLQWLKIGRRTLFRPEDITAYTAAKEE